MNSVTVKEQTYLQFQRDLCVSRMDERYGEKIKRWNAASAHWFRGNRIRTHEQVYRIQLISKKNLDHPRFFLLFLFKHKGQNHKFGECRSAML